MGFLIKKCLKCGATVEVLQDCTCKNCGIQCCGEQMATLKANSSDGAIEKHVPTYEVVGSYVVVSVPHVMQEDHYIEWVALVSDGVVGKKFFKPNEEAKAVFPYQRGSKLYAFCNKHGLWETCVNK